MESIKKVKIKVGDTLSAIAKKYNTSVSELVKVNNISNPNLIIANQELIIPNEEVDINSIVDINRFKENRLDPKINNKVDNHNSTSDVSLNNVNSNDNYNNKVDDNNVAKVNVEKDSKMNLEEIINSNTSKNNVITESMADDKLENVANNLPHDLNYYSNGKCSQLAREILESNSIIKSGSNSNGITYARNLANHPELVNAGYDIKGYEINNNQKEVFNKILEENNNNTENIIISFNSKGHYRNSGSYGHVVTVTNVVGDKVFLLDTSETKGGKWTKKTTPMVMDLDEFSDIYLCDQNSVNYITHIPKI